MKRKGVKFNVKAFEQLRNDPKVVADLLDRADRIRDQAGGEAKGYIVRENFARDARGGVTIIATGHALFSNRKHQSLIKALPAGK